MKSKKAARIEAAFLLFMIFLWIIDIACIPHP